jgi:hypothetical protein
VLRSAPRLKPHITIRRVHRNETDEHEYVIVYPTRATEITRWRFLNIREGREALPRTALASTNAPPSRDVYVFTRGQNHAVMNLNEAELHAELANLGRTGGTVERGAPGRWHVFFHPARRG